MTGGSDCHGTTLLTLNSLQIEGQTAPLKTCFPFTAGTGVRRPQQNEKNAGEEHTFHFHKTNLQPPFSLCKNIYVAFIMLLCENLQEFAGRHIQTSGNTHTHTQAEEGGIWLPRALILEPNLPRQSFQMLGTYAKMLKYQL